MEQEQAKAEAEKFFEELPHASEIVERPDNGRSRISVQPIETPKEGQSPEEVVEEPVQVNLNHLVNEDGSIKLEATDDEMKQLGVDNPKSYRAFQSQFHKERAQREKEKAELLREIESIKSQSTPKQQEEVLRPPQRPTSDDPIEKMNYLEQLAEYQNKVIEGVTTNFHAEQQRRQQIEQEAQQKAYITGQLVNAGASPERAGEIINKLAMLQSDPQAYARFIVQATNNLFDQPSMQNQQKVNAINERVKQQGQALPLGVVPSTVEKPKKADFWDDMTQWTKKNY